MKTKLELLALALLALSTFNSQLSTCRAQGTAFTYQGQLQNNGTLASGTFDLTFTLFKTNITGLPVAGPVTNNAVLATNGVLTVLIDFGAGVFSGTNYWLEIGVKTNGAGGFTTLAPRQQLTPTPYAIYAEGVPAAGISGTLLDAQLLHSAVTVNPGPGLSGGGRVGLGNTITLTNIGALSVTGNADITATTAGGAVTLGDTATSTDTASTLVKRDGSGSFSAATITLDGNLNLPDMTSGNPDIIYSGPGLLLYGDNNGNFFGGNGAGIPSPTGAYNTALGYQSFVANTSGYQNVALGYQALYSNTSGTYNTAVGSDALYSNTNGNYNTANGAGALYHNTSGHDNKANGIEALEFNTSGYLNTASGAGALFSNTNGNYNTANGGDALLFNPNGSENTAIGFAALENLTAGSNNIALGYEAGQTVTAGANNIEIGNQGFASDNQTIRIGGQGTQTNTFIAGIYGQPVSGSAVTVNSFGQLGVAPSSKRFKQDIHSMADASSVLLSLRPVTFKYKPDIDPKGTLQFGLVAEEVAKVDPDLVLRDGKNQIFTVRYEAVNAMLLNEFLKEHRTVEKQTAELETLKRRLEVLEKILLNQKSN